MQMVVLPTLLSGRDCVLLTDTGIGKSLSFVAPAVIHINDQPMLQPGDGPIALFLCPTREFVKQVHEITTRYCRASRIKHTEIHGDLTRDEQIKELQGACEIVVAVPGRINEMLDIQATNCTRLTYLVLDGLDRMLELGFEPYLTKIIKAMRQDGAAQFFVSCAEWTDKECNFVNSCMKNPVCITFGDIEPPIDLNLAMKMADKNYPPAKRQRGLTFEVKKEEENDDKAAVLQQRPPLQGIADEDPDSDGTVLMLRNCVGPGEVDDDLQNEVQEECGKFGPVVESMMFACAAGGAVPSEEAVRIFVRFEQREVCLRAFVALHGRPFGKRLVCCNLYSSKRYEALDLKPNATLDPPMPRVVMLRNMVGPGDVDDELEDEIWEECVNKYGEVVDVKIREVADGSVCPEEAVRIFVKFEDTEGTLEAVRDLNGRLFNGRLVHCCFYDEKRFDEKDLSPEPLFEPPIPPSCKVVVQA
eukprot:TRINITY_DN77051_c0_g1_i1.p1 TRINITY_DN77051_c0_g1~~TRINITY_DN77051_c0_g1_i1.p1  ORF type:complete len:548 (-),score=79.77 TRINITY_DN77051_c0_g1_i1:94-1512(-)